MPRRGRFRRLGGPQGWFGRVQKILPTPGFCLRTIQAVASRYADCTLPAHLGQILLCFNTPPPPPRPHLLFNLRVAVQWLNITLCCMIATFTCNCIGLYSGLRYFRCPLIGTYSKGDNVGRTTVPDDGSRSVWQVCQRTMSTPLSQTLPEYSTCPVAPCFTTNISLHTPQGKMHGGRHSPSLSCTPITNILPLFPARP
jgi:hypothetical protein